MNPDARSDELTDESLAPGATAETADGKVVTDAQNPADGDSADATLEASAPEPGADAEAAPDREAAERRIAELEAEVADARDRQLRAMAELENLRKRTERERADAARYGGFRLAGDMLAAVDAFDRLFSTMDDAFRADHAQFAEGVELIRRSILDGFARNGIQPIEPVRDDAFDPHFHQAMFKEHDEDIDPGRITRLLEKGFRMHDRLLRAARVSLADERLLAAKAEPPPSLPTAGETVDPDTAGLGIDPGPSADGIL